MPADGPDFEYTSETVPPGALFVAANEPLLVFPSVAAAERFLKAIDVEKGVYPAAYGPNGEPYRIARRGKKVAIERIEEPHRPADLRILLIGYLQAWKQPFDKDASTSDLVEQVWRCDSEYWQEMDPYSDRFSRPVPGWCCLALLVIPAALLFVVIRKHPAPIIGVLIALLILWPVGVLAKRRADQTDFRSSG